MPWAGDRRLPLVLALLIALAASAARADYKESYKKGIEAADRKEWSEVARWMRQAAAEQATEGEPVKIYGVRFEPYLPHYYLGLALFQSGDCEGAVAAWQRSDSQGAVQKTSRYKTLQQNRETCRQRLAAQAPPPPPTPTGPDPAQVAREAEARRVAEARAQQEQREKDLQAQREREQREKTQKEQKEREEAERVAREQREAEERQLREEAAREEAAQAEAARLEMENRERAQRQELSREIGRALQDARPLLDRAGEAPSPDADLKRRQAALRDLLRRADAISDATPIADLARLRSEISATVSRLETAVLKAEGKTGGPPAEIRAAARAYLRGDYQEVVRSLGTADLTEQRASLTANLLLGAARYALWVQGGEKDAQLQEKARENVRACRRLDPRLVPDSKVFSPRFTSFFKSAD